LSPSVLVHWQTCYVGLGAKGQICPLGPLFLNRSCAGVLLDDCDRELTAMEGHVTHVTENGTLDMGDNDYLMGVVADGHDVVLNARELQTLEDGHDVVLTAMELQTLENLFSQAQCAICLADFALKEVVNTLPCGHVYHSDCLSPWLTKSRCCPMCKRDCCEA